MPVWRVESGCVPGCMQHGVQYLSMALPCLLWRLPPMLMGRLWFGMQQQHVQGHLHQAPQAPVLPAI